ncbi:hypothetical protein HDIA_0674 [Hartmannibacter diazotrophicus]|uniref:Uncharacterized protein n=2 Tax=Hartmannibacter diazotrophicus TaxID=1482074 RepID=A0A2C9D411_9HYPH|nr:hypothetical protein HDIA_0674 [Hartmannibacter diazotrophicus]
MSELPYDGYRFKHRKPGQHQPNGGLERFVLVVARTMDDAISAIKEQTTSPARGFIWSTSGPTFCRRPAGAASATAKPG